ncbi:hypothetical protein Nhal_0967 [Nitrosococcus halophilus Nc 4]|uniref:Uncharacterized protein n=2 Tax=Nitrosococcus halophilus TaxID=133539 RepID=D5BYF7_NITHN|nr:hypothetical protein Nhal_0967 [Nitrosococcus halophilus Nc 4]
MDREDVSLTLWFLFTAIMVFAAVDFGSDCYFWFVDLIAGRGLSEWMWEEFAK